MIHFIKKSMLVAVLLFQLISPKTVLGQITNIPADIQSLLEKDLSTLSDEEMQLVLPYVAVPIPSGLGITPLENTVNCFDYYHFGSVQVSAAPALAQTIPGVPMTFTGFVRNKNAYPVVNGTVYVKIFKAGEEDFQRQNGYPVVDFFPAATGLQLPAAGEVPFTFDWQVPQSLSGGKYAAAFFFVVDNRFNLSGLTFTDDIIGSRADFFVTSADGNQVVFEKNTVLLNDKPYYFSAFTPSLGFDESAEFSAEVSNPTSAEKRVMLTWQVYNWDGIRADQMLTSKAEEVILAPKEKRRVTYDSGINQVGAVSYVVGTIKDGDAKSIINPRYVRDSTEEVRLNFPSLTKFPLVSGEENMLFSCAHSTNLPVVDGNKLTMTLSDTETGALIYEYVYEGSVTGTMMGVADTFIPTKSYDNVTLTTTLERYGKLVDSISQIYDCRILAPNDCLKKLDNSVLDVDKSKSISVIVVLFVVFILIVALISIKFYIKRRSLLTSNNQDQII